MSDDMSVTSQSSQTEQTVQISLVGGQPKIETQQEFILRNLKELSNAQDRTYNVLSDKIDAMLSTLLDPNSTMMDARGNNLKGEMIRFARVEFYSAVGGGGSNPQATMLAQNQALQSTTTYGREIFENGMKALSSPNPLSPYQTALLDMIEGKFRNKISSDIGTFK